MAKRARQPVATTTPSYIAPAEVDESVLNHIREEMKLTRDREKRIADLRSVLGEEQKALNQSKMTTLPELFARAGIDNLGLPAEGNNPAYDFKLRNYTHASIAADWEKERKDEAFKILEHNGGKDLIKTEIACYIPPEKRGLVKKAVAALKKLGIVPDVESSVPWNTLTAFIKEATEKRNIILPLDKLGATQGMIVEWKERKADGPSKEESTRPSGNKAPRRGSPEGTGKARTY
jgi:hypothetical protein